MKYVLLLLFLLPSIAVSQSVVDSAIVRCYQAGDFERVLVLADSIGLDHMSFPSLTYIGLTYLRQRDYGSAIPILMRVVNGSTSQDDYYYTALYRVGHAYSQRHDYHSSNQFFLKYHQLDTTDYSVLPELIQNYFALNAPDSAKPFQTKLYLAHALKQLPKHLAYEYCYDRFQIDSMMAYACERYPQLGDPETLRSFSKQCVYFYGTGDSLLFTFETVKIHQATPSPVKFLLNKRWYSNGYVSRSESYWQHTFPDPVDYSRLKSAIIAVLKEDADPSAVTKWKRQ